MNKEELKELETALKNGLIEDKPYVFVSYANKDKERVFPVIKELRNKGINVYVDLEMQENITQNWIANVRKHLYTGKCKGMVSFLSIHYLRSYPCFMEQMMASTEEMKQKINKILPICYISLEENMNTPQGIESVIYDDDVQSESEAMLVKMQPFERNELEKVMKDNTAICEKMQNVSEKLDKIKTKHDVVTYMYNYIISGELGISIQPYCSAEECADLLYNNFVNTKNKDIQLQPLEKLIQVKNKTKNGKAVLSVTGGITYTLYGMKYTQNQSDMMFAFFEEVLKRHQDKVSTLPNYAGMNCASLVDYTKRENIDDSMPSYFNRCEYFKFDNGAGICIGTAYSLSDKLKKMALLLAICEESEEIFVSEQVELPEVKKVVKGDSTKGKGNSDTVTYYIYGKEYTGNQSEMLETVCYEILYRHTDCLKKAEEELSCIALSDWSNVAKEERPVYFSIMKCYEIDGVLVSVGASYSMNAKLKLIARLLKLCDEPADVFRVEA
jgi:hypothetical protein